MSGEIGAGQEQPVYLLTRGEITDERNHPVSVVDLWRLLWDGKWIIVGATVIFAIAAIVLAVTAVEWYRAETVLSPATSSLNSGLSGQLASIGSLGGLIGLPAGGAASGNSAEALAVLQSSGFTRAFIEEQKLLPVLYAKQWDAAAGAWKSADPAQQPDLDDATEFFDKSIRRIQEDRRSGLVKLSIQWTDRKLAAQWANALVERLNSRMRERDLTQAEQNVQYLRKELADESTLVLQQSIGRLLESELQKVMVARGKIEYSYGVIDHAVPPKWRDRPKRTQIVIAGTLFGGLIGIFAVFIRRAVIMDLRRSRGVVGSHA